MTDVTDNNIEKRISDEALQEAYLKSCELPIIKAAFKLLESELPTKYCYHSEHHSRDVIKESLRFGMSDNLTEQELLCLVVAAAWHDVGFIQGKINHEELSIKYLEEFLETVPIEDILADEERETICQLIRDTKLFKTEDGIVQIPSHDLSKYLLDADLSNLGRSDFFDCLDLLCMEHEAESYDFYRRTLGFVTRHTWHTDTARTLRLNKEMENAVELARRILDERYLLVD